MGAPNVGHLRIGVITMALALVISDMKERSCWLQRDTCAILGLDSGMSFTHRKGRKEGLTVDAGQGGSRWEIQG